MTFMRSTDRRAFIGQLAAFSATVPFARAAESGPLAASDGGELGPLTHAQRRRMALEIRIEAARFQYAAPVIPLDSNGDESSPLGSIACFGKTLDHNSLGETEPSAYDLLRNALASGRAADFDAIPRASAGKLANPQSSYAFSLEGPDAHQVPIPSPPRFASAEMASEMVEVYWQALTRDVPFAEFDSSPAIQQAARELGGLPDFRGPKVQGQLTSGTIFRGGTVGDLNGPYMSQFLWKPLVYGLTPIEQKYRTTAAQTDYMTNPVEWLSIQQGSSPSQTLALDVTPRYIRNGRDLAAYVYRDFSYQAVLNAALLLTDMGNAALSDENPYKKSISQTGGITFGSFQILDWLARVTTAAMKAAWCQKWLVHRRIRPEETSGRIHQHLSRKAAYPLHQSVLNSTAVAVCKERYGSYLLPMAYPDGCPPHPSYPAGHAVIAGAGVTVLKAFFQGDMAIPDPVVASADGLSLAPYSSPPGGPRLTIAGELNKLASNIAIGRDTAGVHYRSDGIQGLRLGEAVAIGVLHDLVSTLTEEFEAFRLSRFDGTEITICRDCIL